LALAVPGRIGGGQFSLALMLEAKPDLLVGFAQKKPAGKNDRVLNPYPDELKKKASPVSASLSIPGLKSRTPGSGLIKQPVNPT